MARKSDKNTDPVSTYIVSYDICDPKRLRLVFKLMKGWGMHMQYSVFQCNLKAQDLTELQSNLEDLIDHSVDQVLFVDVGPVRGRAKNAITSIGKAHTIPLDGPVIV